MKFWRFPLLCFALLSVISIAVWRLCNTRNSNPPEVTHATEVDVGGGRAGPQATARNQQAAAVKGGAVAAVDPQLAHVNESFQGTRASLVRYYGKPFSTFGLSPAELDQLFDLFTERRLSAEDAVLTAGRLRSRGPSVQAALQAAEGEIDTQIRRLFGEQVFEQFTFLADVATNHVTDIYRIYDSAMIQNGVALTPQQHLSLTKSLQAVYGTRHYTDEYVSELRSLPPGASWTPQDEELLAECAGRLSDAQINTLRKSIAEQNRHILGQSRRL